MQRIFSLNFWVQAFVSAFITMICMWCIKRVSAKVNIPGISTIVEEV